MLKEKEEKGKFESLSKRYRSSRKSVVVDYDEECIRKVIYSIYKANEHVTLSKLLEIVREDKLFYGGHAKLARF